MIGPRLGLSHAALKAAILAALEESGLAILSEPIANAVADAMDANNQEVMRQLRDVFETERALEASDSS